MNTLSERLNQRMQEKGFNQSSLARKAGISRASVSQWLCEQNSPSAAAIVKLAHALECSAEWLQTGKEGAVRPISTIDAWDSATPLHSDDVELPLFREVELSAGSGRTEVIENHGAKLRFAKSSLAKQGVSPDSAACCFVSGDSMEPVLPDGSTVGIDTAQTTITDGKMYAIDYAGMLRVKLLYRVPGGIKIRSINREYDDEIVTGENLDTLRIIGKVFWSASFHS